MKRRQFAALALGSLGTACLGSCVRRSPLPKEILIGATYPKTGRFAMIAGRFDKLMHTWADMVNGKGGFYLKDYGQRLPIRFLLYNDDSDVEKSRQLYKKLIREDQVHLLMGPYSSDISMGASAVAEKYNIPMLLFEANSGPIFTRNFQWMTAVMSSGGQWSHAYFDMMKVRTNAKTVAFVVEDNLHPKEVYEGATRRASQLGFQVVAAKILLSGIKDFSETVTALKALNPDIIYVSALPPFAIGFTQQAKVANLSPKALHVVHHKLPFLQALGDGANLVTGDTFWTPSMKGEGAEEFAMLLTRSHLTVEAYPETAIRMFSFQALRAAIEQAGNLDHQAIRQAMRSLDIMTIGGKLTIASDGSGSMNPVPTQIRDGQYVSIWPEEIATTQYLYPRNSDQAQGLGG